MSAVESVRHSARTAGGVLVLRSTGFGVRVAVLEAGGLVSLPRSEVGPGENTETAARRAASHFVGVDVRLTEPLGEATDLLDDGLPQVQGPVQTHYWLGRTRPGALFRPSAPPPLGFRLCWLSLEDARDSLHSEGERELVVRIARRDLRTQATLALSSTAMTGVVLASFGLFRDAPARGAATFGAGSLALVYVLAGALGGWVGESLGALRGDDRSGRVGAPLRAAMGGCIGLALGAFLTAGLSDVPAGASAAATLVCVFAAGWFGRLALRT